MSLSNLSVKLSKNIPSLVTRLIMFSGANAIAQLLSAVYLLLLARWLLQEKYGVFAGCYAAATVSSFLINWGMDTWLLRQAATHSDPLQLTGTVLKVKAVLGTAWAVAVWGILAGFRSDFYAPLVLALVLLDTWFDAGLITLSALFNATGRTSTISGLLIASRGLRLVSAVLLIVLQQVQILPFVAIRLACTTGILIAAVSIARPVWNKPVSITPREVWRQSLPYAGTDILVAIYAQIDIFLLSLLAGKVATGLYAPAVSLVNALISLVISGFWLFVPYLTQVFNEDPAKLRKLFYQMMALLFVIGSALSLFLAMFGPFFTKLLLSTAYQTSGELLKTMSPILFFKAMSMGFAALLVSAGRQRERLLPQLISACANLLLNLWAIPRWGPMGAAMVYLASEAILMVGYGIRALLYLQRTGQA